MDKTTIIVVEDNIVYCEFVCNMLAREGYRTVKAYHLSTAKKHLQQATDNDIVVADLRDIAKELSKPGRDPRDELPLFLVLLVGALAYLKYGPSEKNNVNANTSGVAALLRTAEQLTPRYRNDVCFLFLDGGSDNMRGAKGFRKRYPSAKEKPVLCLDCVGSGDELLILPGKGARWNGELLDAINSSFENSERKTCYDKVDGLVHFPGDQRAFRQGVAVCAVRRVPGFGRFICPTGKDNRIDDENLELLSRGLVKLAAAYQIKK